mmetsp:Transcript_2767/g.4349  ORF Transcript_2767/g.4349 Transcript_2767/m.4349 type:complete len:106 (+) Transcript_2767:1188-1505(+)
MLLRLHHLREERPQFPVFALDFLELRLEEGPHLLELRRKLFLWSRRRSPRLKRPLRLAFCRGLLSKSRHHSWAWYVIISVWRTPCFKFTVFFILLRLNQVHLLYL